MKSEGTWIISENWAALFNDPDLQVPAGLIESGLFPRPGRHICGPEV